MSTLLLAAAVAASTPVYLVCRYDEARLRRIAVTVDEDKGTVTWREDVYRAAFTATTVTFGHWRTGKYTISRVNLDFDMRGGLRGPTARMEGTCRKVDPPERAF